MNKWHDLLSNWAIIVMLTLIVILNISASYFKFSLITKVTALAIIPALFVFYYYKQRLMANVFFTIFTLYFLGMLFNALDYLNLSSKLSQACYLGAYALLAFVMIGKLKNLKIEGIVTLYLIVIFLTTSYFMYILYGAVKDSFSDSVILTLFLSKTVALWLSGFLAFVICLSRESSQSILFLTVVCCFVFSEVLSSITTLYVTFWLFEAIQNILQGAGLLLFCIYVYNYQELANSLLGARYKSISQSKHNPIQA